MGALNMRIAQIAPLHESVPPRLYGGTERVVSWLTEELVRQGHDVTLYASGDSRTEARLRVGCHRALRLEAQPTSSPLAHHVLLMERVAQEADEFDLLHFHLDYLPFPLIRRLGLPAISTLHGRLDIPDLFPLYREFVDMNLVSISDAQRCAMPWANWVSTVHHGLPEDLYRPGYEPGEYLVFLGRISPEKRVDRAVEIARRAGMPLLVSAKIDHADRAYFNEIRHILDQPHVKFLGEVGDSEKAELLSHAAALLFPIDWPEPFGLVMIESLACGTPVIAFRHGSVPEVLENGLTGYIIDSIEEAVEAVHRIPTIERKSCREEFERRFSARRMCEEYLSVYERVIAEAEDGRRGFALIA
jgi:glycosyltransferase involved in cell wall biosynthesis